MTGILIRRGKFGHRHRHTQREDSHVKNEGRNLSDAPTSQRTLRIAGNHQKLGRGKEVFFPRASLQRAQDPADALLLDFYPTGTVRLL